MKRYIVEGGTLSGGRLALTGGEAHHAVVVNRLRTGESFVAIDGTGGEFLCEAAEVSSKRVIGRIIAERFGCGEPSIQVILAQSLLKGKSLTQALDGAVQMGISDFIPFTSVRSVARPKSPQTLQTKLEKVAREATKQCERSVIPRIHNLTTVQRLVEDIATADIALLLTLAEGAVPLDEALSGMKDIPKKLLIMVGPEGGFSEEEVGNLRCAGAVAVSLGPQRIRASLAGTIACAGIMMYFKQMLREEKEWTTVSSAK